jgi:tetratricopeptide (TPR) repeat protein
LKTRFFGAWLVLSLLLNPGALLLAQGRSNGKDAASEKKAKDFFLRGKTFYNEGKFEEAIRAFRAAEAIHPSPILDFNKGRCFHQLNRLDQAIAAYERYLAERKEAGNREEVQAWITELKEKKALKASDPYEELDRSAGTTAAPASQPTSAPAAPLPVEKPAQKLRAEQAPPDYGSELPHEAARPSSWEPRSNAQSVAPDQPVSPREEGPLYKQWWFWVACASGALITGLIIATAVSSQHTSSPGPAVKSQSLLSVSF